MIRNQSAWRAGFAAGLDRDEDCPFPAGSVKALSWSDGWIDISSRLEAAECPIR
jgi:hypothetical protein